SHRRTALRKTEHLPPRNQEDLGLHLPPRRRPHARHRPRRSAVRPRWRRARTRKAKRPPRLSPRTPRRVASRLPQSPVKIPIPGHSSILFHAQITFFTTHDCTEIGAPMLHCLHTEVVPMQQPRRTLLRFSLAAALALSSVTVLAQDPT